jgi:putative hydrolase of the HAD superfamily
MVVRAILFDYGGTLDGGIHWLERFAQLYPVAGLDFPLEQIRAAFDHATRRCYGDPAVAAFGLETPAAAAIVAAFVHATRAALAESRVLLSRLRQRVALGVVSNFYGNVHRILEEAELAPLLGAIVDSGVVGVRKPDPEIFTLAVTRLGLEPEEVLHVGDSFEKDIVGAHAAGLRTGWLTGAVERPCCSPECVDVRLRCLADLEPLIARWQNDGSPCLSR